MPLLSDVSRTLLLENKGETMTDHRKAAVPVWTLATDDVRVPAVVGDGLMTAERLAELRGVLAALADAPIATLEVHPLPDKLDRSRGIPLDAASPLAQHLSQFITQSTRSSLTAARATAAGENLYRMVVPAKVAAQFGQGVVRPMASKAAAGGIHSALVNSTGIAANATFVPVGKAAAAGAVGGAGATAGVAAVGSAALTVAAPLVLMAVAVGVSAHADYKRQQAIEHIRVPAWELRGRATSGAQTHLIKTVACAYSRGMILRLAGTSTSISPVAAGQRIS